MAMVSPAEICNLLLDEIWFTEVIWYFSNSALLVAVGEAVAQSSRSPVALVLKSAWPSKIIPSGA